MTSQRLLATFVGLCRLGLQAPSTDARGHDTSRAIT
jgi:hypothetical protein